MDEWLFIEAGSHILSRMEVFIEDGWNFGRLA
jgi:hypothetical protein